MSLTPENRALEPCPFCGSVGKIIERGGAFGVRCAAKEHFAHTYGETRQDAIAAWNAQFHGEQASREEIARLTHSAFVDEHGNELRCSQPVYQEVKRLRDEIEQTRFLVTGGEDAPGHIMSLPFSEIERVAEENRAAWYAEADRAEAAEAQLADTVARATAVLNRYARDIAAMEEMKTRNDLTDYGEHSLALARSGHADLSFVLSTITTTKEGSDVD